MLSVIVPTYCERDNIPPLLSRLAAVREVLREPLEVVVVDNGSTDGTADHARGLLEAGSLGRVIEVAGKDLAKAVAMGIQQAKGDLIGVMDGDLSHPPELLPALVASVRNGSDVAVASRYVRGGRIERWPWSRRALSWLGNLLARPLVRVADATSGYFVCHPHVLKSLKEGPKGFKILLEVLVRGDVRHVEEVPYVFVNRVRGSSKLQFRVLWHYLAQVGRLYCYRVNRDAC